VDQGQLASLDLGRGDLSQWEPGMAYPCQNRLDTLAALGMARPGVVAKRRRMARNYNIHVLTLAQVPNLLRVEGSWPGPIALRAGWFRARARPWNETITDPMLRLERGGAEFLIAVTRELLDLGAGEVYSPALYGSASNVWQSAGFVEYARLDVMERPLRAVAGLHETAAVTEDPEPDWDEILEVDRAAFEGFWGMSRLGLSEAHETNRAGTTLVTETDGRVSGYAIVGTQWGTIYLHRIAVHPQQAGKGLGASLLRAAIRWGADAGGRSMVLNVRPENERAKSLYRRHGFTDTGTALRVLRRERE
jgi:ribosomal protein S18 acetylase RimI-like enzyme